MKVIGKTHPFDELSTCAVLGQHVRHPVHLRRCPHTTTSRLRSPAQSSSRSEMLRAPRNANSNRRSVPAWRRFSSGASRDATRERFRRVRCRVSPTPRAYRSSWMQPVACTRSTSSEVTPHGADPGSVRGQASRCTQRLRHSVWTQRPGDRGCIAWLHRLRDSPPTRRASGDHSK